MTDYNQSTTIPPQKVLAKMRHNMGQPMRAVQLLVSANSDMAGAELRAGILRSMDEACADVDGLIDYLTLLENASSGITVDINDVVASVVEAQSPMAERGGVEIIWTDPICDQRLEVRAQPCRALINALVLNAIEFSQNGSVALEAEESNDGVMLSIRDAGVGIPASDQALIFEPYFSAQPEKAGRTNRCGLGLTTAAMAAKVLGATLTVESEGVDAGTCARLHFPLGGL